MRGVDVSWHNGDVDWWELKDAGIDFAIIRTGYGCTGRDDYFVRNVDRAHAAGLICGAYHYSCAITDSDAAQEAIFCKKIIEDSGVFLELPVWFDMEDADGYKARHGFNFSKRHVTNLCKTFLKYIKPLNCGIYASYSWLEKYIDWRELDCSIWNAQWGSHDFLQGYMWQYTDNLQIGGQIFDGNIIYDAVDKAG